MDAETAAIFGALDPLLERYESWREPLNQYFSQNLTRINQGGYTCEQFERGRVELEAALAAHDDPQPDLFRWFEKLCANYLTCDAGGRAEMRDRVGNRRRLGQLIHGYADWLAAEIRHADDTQKLQLALAAVLIDNCGSDYRDTLLTLADLFVSAEQAGIEPMAVFKSMSALATDSTTPGGCDSLARILREFESYAVLGERRGTGRRDG
jgi:hypothetical protein